MSSVDRIEEVSGNSRYIRMGGAVNINYFALDESYHRQVYDTLPSGDRIYLSDILLIEMSRKNREYYKSVYRCYICYT